MANRKVLGIETGVRAADALWDLLMARGRSAQIHDHFSEVTIAAMGCQTETAEKIVVGGADYVLAVKGNQPTLHAAIEAFFREHVEDNLTQVRVNHREASEKGHGRKEERTYLVCDTPEDLAERERWRGLKRIGVAISDTIRGGKPASDVRYDITSRELNAKEFAATVRSHWSIENRCDWPLDVTFGDEQSRLRRGHADANFSAMRRTALSLLKNHQSEKIGLKDKKLIATSSDEYREQVLSGR